MRVFVKFEDQTGSWKTARIQLKQCPSTTIFIKQIISKLKLPLKPSSIILKATVPQSSVQAGHLSIIIYAMALGQLFIQYLSKFWRFAAQHHLNLYKIVEVDLEQDLTCDQLQETFESKHQSKTQANLICEQKSYKTNRLESILNIVRCNQLDKLAQTLKQKPPFMGNMTKQQAHNYQVQEEVFVLNQLGQCGRNCLHWAIHNKNVEMVSFLLIKQVNPNVVSVDGYTPLQLAIVKKLKSISQLLIQLPKIDINQVTIIGSALTLATTTAQIEIVKLLLKNGADPQLQIQTKTYNNDDNNNNNNNVKTALDLCKDKDILYILKKAIKSKTKVVPYILKGKVLKKSIFRNKMKIMQINPFTNKLTIMQEDKKAGQQSYNLTAFTEISTKPTNNNNNILFFEIKGMKQYLIFGVKNQKILNAWIQHIQVALQYASDHENQIGPPQNQQIILVLDDQLSKLVLKKVKPSISMTKSMSILDISYQVCTPTQDNNMQYGPDSSLSTIKSIESSPILSEYQYLSPVNQNGSIISSYIQSSQLLRPQQILQGSIIGSILSTTSNQTIRGFRQSTLITSNGQMSSGPSLISFKDFEIKKQIGSGAFGRVFLAKYKNNNRNYALKVLNKKRLAAKKLLKHAVNQTNILKKIDHPFIITLHFSFQTPNNLYLALDHCPYGDLAQLLNQKQKFTDTTAKFIIAQIILAIDHLHTNGIIYRDLKPQNILIAQDNYIRLTDFGLSKQKKIAMSFCGSPIYLSPQMIQRRGVTNVSDWYSVGCVLYQIITGQPPFFNVDQTVLYEQIATATLKFPESINVITKSFIRSLMQRNPTKRLGANGLQQILKHQYFKNYNWDHLKNKTAKIPSEFAMSFDHQLVQLDLTEQCSFEDQDYVEGEIAMTKIHKFTFVRDYHIDLVQLQ